MDEVDSPGLNYVEWVSNNILYILFVVVLLVILYLYYRAPLQVFYSNYKTPVEGFNHSAKQRQIWFGDGDRY